MLESHIFSYEGRDFLVTKLGGGVNGFEVRRGSIFLTITPDEGKAGGYRIRGRGLDFYGGTDAEAALRKTCLAINREDPPPNILLRNMEAFLQKLPKAPESP